MRDKGPDNDKIVRYGNHSESEISDLATWENHDPEVRQPIHDVASLLHALSTVFVSPFASLVLVDR